MAPGQMKMPTKKDFDNEHEEVFSQRKRPESGRYLLQVDRQTKGSYKTSEAAQAAGREIKAAYPIVQVSIYDSIDNSHALRGGNARFISAGDGCSGNRRSAIIGASCCQSPAGASLILAPRFSHCIWGIRYIPCS